MDKIISKVDANRAKLSSVEKVTVNTADDIKKTHRKVEDLRMESISKNADKATLDKIVHVVWEISKFILPLLSGFYLAKHYG